jgi:hypothetical protein
MFVSFKIKYLKLFKLLRDSGMRPLRKKKNKKYERDIHEN